MKYLMCFLVGALLSATCSAQRSTPLRVLQLDGSVGDKFGNAVAVSGDTMIIGASEDVVGTNAGQGSAHVYVWTGTAWNYEATLTASDGASTDSFGYSVAISGDTVIVGAPGHNIGAALNQGAAYIFVRSDTTWTQQAKLTATDGAANDQFGFSVALSGDTALVGANLDDAGTIADQGSVYVFGRSGTNWTQHSKLTASDGATADAFGSSVALSAETAIVGAIGVNGGANINQGSGYVFVRSGIAWTEQAKLTAPDGAPNDNLGFAAAISGDTVVLGAYLDDEAANSNQGSAHVFSRAGSTWTHQAKLVASDGVASGVFGTSVGLFDDTVIVGAPGDDVGANNAQGSAYVFTRTGSNWTQQAKFTDVQGVAGDRLGSSVALCDNFAVLGAVNASAGLGAAWAYSRVGDNWIAPDTRILASNGAATDLFGMSVSVSGDYAVVGAGSRTVGANNNQGAAYVYLRAGHQWVQQAMLVASDGVPGDNFGQSVSISGDTIVVGADRNDLGGGVNADRGAAYVFVRSGATWTQQAKLFAPDAASGDQFGFSVAIDGNTAVVGSYLNDVGAGINQGSAYIFLRTGTTWAFVTQLTAADGALSDSFGVSVAISGDTVLVGAYLDNVGLNVDQGSAYVFTRSGLSWSQQAKLTASDGAVNDNFGWSVGLSGDTALVGAFAADVSGLSASGAAYAFILSGTVWTEQQKITPPDPATDDNFAKALALSGNTAIIGAPLDDVAGKVNQGTAYIFTRVGSAWFFQHEAVEPAGAAGDSFGVSVGVSGSAVIVGVPNSSVGANATQGAARLLDAPYEDFRNVYDETLGFGYASLSSALQFPFAGTEFLATETAFRYSGTANTGINTVTVRSSGDIHSGFNRVFQFGGSSSLVVPAGRTISIFDAFISYPAASVRISADSFLLGSRGTLTARASSSIFIDAPASFLEGLTTVQAGSSISFSGAMENIGPVTALAGSSLSAGGTITNIDLTLFTDTAVATPLYLNRDSVTFEGTCTVAGALTNNDGAVALINSGSLDVSGTFINNGVLATSMPSPHLTVGASLVQSATAGFIMPFSASVVRVGGNFDAAINSNAAFALSLATLRLDGSGAEQTMEAMSKDIGPSALGLDRVFPGHFPIGTLEIATGATVRLVDARDNDTLGQAACEAIYVNELRINPGARLINTACAKVYYNTLFNSGTVDVPSGLIAIGTLPCVGDLNADLFVDDADFVLFADAYNTLDCADPTMPVGCPADLNFDGFVDDADFVQFAAAYDTLVCP